MLLNNNSLIMQWNRDENGNPISWHIPLETQQISPTHGVIQLVQVPDQHYRMKIVTENNIQLTEVFNIQDVEGDNYYVDYGVGIVHFHKSQHGKMVKIDYYGRGVILISDSRIFHKDGENITDTWDNILNRSQDALDLIESAGGLVGAMEKIDEKVAQGEATADRLENFITETQFYGYTITLSREAFVVKAQENGEVGKSEVSTVYTDVVVYQGAKQIIPTLSIEQEQGCSFKIDGQRVKLSSIDINVIKAGAVLNIDCGEGLVAQRVLEVTKVFDGVSQYAIEMTNAFYSFEADSTGAVTDEQTVTCDISVTKANVDYTNYALGVQNAPVGLRYTVGATGVQFHAETGSLLPSSGSCLVIVMIDGTSFTKTFSWTKTKRGQDAKSLTLVGNQIVRYDTPDYSDIPSPYRSTVSAKMVGLSGTPEWYVKKESGWELLTGEHQTELYIIHNDERIWGNRKETTVKCSLEDYEDELTLVKLATGGNGADAITVLLTNESHTLAIDNSGMVHQSEIDKATTSVIAYRGTQQITPTLAKGKCDGCDIKIIDDLVQLVSLDNSSTTATATINVTIDGITIPKTWSLAKAKQGYDGADGSSGNSYILNITDGTRSFTYSQINHDPRPSMSNTFVATLYENGIEVLDDVSYYWTTQGHLQGSSLEKTFTPTISKTFDESILNNDVQLIATYKGNTITQVVPIAVTKDANGLDWVQEWDSTKTDVRGNLILTPKLFAGAYDAENDLITGVAIGQDVLNDGRSIGVVGYQNNKASFLLDTDGSLMVGNPFEENSTGLYYDNGELVAKVHSLTIQGAEVPTTDEITTVVDEKLNSAKAELLQEFEDVNGQIGELGAYMDGALKDGILDEVERNRLNTLFENIGLEVNDVDAQFVSISQNPHLTNVALFNQLTEAYDAYTNKHEEMEAVFNTILEAPTVDIELVGTFNLLLEEFIELGKTLRQVMTDALSSISTSISEQISEQAKEEIRGEIADVSDALGSLEETMNGDFKSGLISTMNLTTLRSKVSQLETEKADIDGQYSGIINHPKLGTTSKTNLAIAKGELDTAHDQLIIKINSAIADNLMTEAELTEINLLITKYAQALKMYSEIAQQANADIALNLAQGAIEALNQEDIFNKLTNNGETQGIYLQDGKVYINGEYINSRNLKAVRNDGTETFKIDSEGNVSIKATSFHVVGEDTNIPTKEYVDGEIGKISLGNINIILSNEAQVISTNSNSVPLANQSFAVKVQMYQGTKEITDFTIGTVSGTNGITTSVSQSTKIVVFSVSTETTISAVSGKITIPLIYNDKTYNKEWSWAIAKQGNAGATGSAGANAKYVTVAGEQVFKYSNNFTGTPTPSSITLTASVYNTTVAGKWQYLSDSSWVDCGATAKTLTLQPTSYTLSSLKRVTVRYIVDDVYDTFTVVAVSDGANGIDGVDGQDGADGKGVTSITEQYYHSTSMTTQTGGSWSTTVPTATRGKYIWTRSVIKYTDSTTTTTTPICVSGSDGTNGNNGTDGDDGVSITLVDVEYAQNTSTTTAPTSGWTTTSPTWASGKYIWSRTKTTYSDGKTTYTNPACITGQKGDTGASGKGIKSITEYYLVSSASTGVTTSTSGWSTTVPTMTTTNRYMWNYEVIAYTDSSTTTSTPKVIGVYGNTGATGATGATGNGIKSITNYYLVSSSSSGVTTSTSGWTTTIQQTTTTNKYLWNYEVVAYTNGTSTTTTPIIIGTHGATGATGSAGADAITIVLTNENHTFSANSSGNIASAQTTTTNITAYKGASTTSVTIGTLPTVTGLTLSKSGSTVTIQANTGTSLADTGTFTIPLTIDGKSFTKNFSWTKVKAGATGATGASAPHVIVNGEQVFKYTNNFSGTPTPSSITLTATKVNTTASGKWQWLNGSTWTDWSSDSTTLTSTTLSVSPTAGSLNTGKSIRIRYLVGSVYDEVTIVKVSDGANGTNGTNGVGVSGITEYYAVSSSNSTAPTTWHTTVQTMTATNKYLWNYEEIRYTNSTTTTTAKRVIGVYGDKGATGNTGATGATGNGVSKITNYYLATSSSSGVTTSTSGWTTTIQTMTSTKKYLWNYEVITYTNGSNTTTTPCIIGAYGDKGATGATGSAGADAYTVILTNESHTFPTQSNGNIATALSTTTQVLAYKGATSITPTIGTLPTVTGLTLSKSGTTVTIQANTGTSLADTGTLSIPITVDGKSFTKNFSWTKAKAGATGATGSAGTNAKAVDIIASSQVFKSTDGGTTFSPSTIKLTPKLQNLTYSNWQYSTNGGSSWTTVSSGSNGLTISSGVLTISKDSALYTSSVTSVAFRVNTNDSAYYDVATIVKLYDVGDIQVGSRNYLLNSNFTKTTTSSGTTNKNPNLYPSNWGGYNGGISNPTTNYHAHIDNTTFGYNVVEYNETDGTRHWKGISQGSIQNRIKGVKEFTISMDVYATASGTKTWGGFHYTKIGGTTQNFHAGSFSIGSDKISVGKWSRVSAKVPMGADVDFSKPISFYIYGYGFSSNAILYIKDVVLTQGNTMSDWTPAPEDVSQEIDDSIKDYDKTLNQLAVFNKLTNNGQTQGIYLQDSKLYINGEYIKASSISGNKILAGSITANEIKAGAITANMITSGTFSGVNFFAGGRGSSGLIKVLDSNNNVSFSASSAGITATLISFESSINSGGTAVRGNKYARMNSEGTVATTVVSNSALSSSSSAFTTGSGFEIVEEITQNNGGTYTNYEERVSLTTSGLYLGSYGSIGGTMTSALRLQKFANQYALRIEGTDSFANGGFGIYRSQTNVFNVSSSGVVKIGNGVQLSTSSDGNRLKIQTSYGNITVGPYNTDWCHFSTDRAKFWFEKNVHVNGEIYAGSSYNNRVYHTGWSPKSGNWWSGGAVVVGTDGVCEVGKYLDFHNTNSSTADYDIRLSVQSGNLESSGGLKAQGNISAVGSLWAGGCRVGVQAGHGGLDLGNSDRATAICSSSQPTWWNGSVSRQLVYSENDSSGYPAIISNGGNSWIRTPSSGIIPHTSGTGSGRSNIGSDGWRFSTGYFNNVEATSVVYVGRNGSDSGSGFVARRYLNNKQQSAKCMIINTGGGCASILHRNETNSWEVQFLVQAWSAGTGCVRPNNNGGIENGTSAYKWKVVYASNGTVQTSDERFKVKRGLTNVEDCFEMVKNTQLYKYTLLDQNKEDLSKNRLGKIAMECEDDDAKVHIGIMAQDLQQYECGKHILVEGEYEKEDGTTDTMLHINPLDMTMAVMGGLKKEIEIRETENKKLTEEVEALRSEVEELKAMVQQLLILK